MIGSGRPARAARRATALCAALAAAQAFAEPQAHGGAPLADSTARARALVAAQVPQSPAKALRLAAAAPDAETTAPEIRYKDTPPPPGMWRRPTGKWMTLVGVALLAGGTTVAIMNRQLSKDLESKYFDNTLTPSDASKYDQVDTYNTVQAVLLAAGAATTGVGLYLWGTAPDASAPGRSATFGVQGRF